MWLGWTNVYVIHKAKQVDFLRATAIYYLLRLESILSSSQDFTLRKYVDVHASLLSGVA